METPFLTLYREEKLIVAASYQRLAENAYKAIERLGAACRINSLTITMLQEDQAFYSSRARECYAHSQSWDDRS